MQQRIFKEHRPSRRCARQDETPQPLPQTPPDAADAIEAAARTIDEIAAVLGQADG